MLTLRTRASRVVLVVGLLEAATTSAGQGDVLTAPIGSESNPITTLTLAKAVAEALARSPVLAESEFALRTAEVRREAANSAFGVRLTPALSSGIESLGLVRQSLGIGVAKRLGTGADVSVDMSSFRYAGNDANQRDLGFSFRVTQPLLSGFGAAAKADVDAASRGLDSARRGALAARQQLVLTVADAFFSVVRQQRLLAASRQARERAQALRESTDARAKVGLATELDSMRARLLASNAAAMLARDTEALETGRDHLRRLLGRPLDTPLVVDEDIPMAPEAPVDVEAVVLRARALRIEVVDARAQIDTVRRAADVVRWQSLPPVALDVGYQRRGSWNGSVPFPLFDSGWHASITSGAGLGRGTAQALQRNAALAVTAAEQQARDVEMRVAVEVRAAARTVTRTIDAITLAGDAIELARRQRELVELRYQRGLATSLDVVDAEAMLYQTESTAIAARIEHALARLTLERASGTLSPDAWAH